MDNTLEIAKEILQTWLSDCESGSFHDLETLNELRALLLD